MRESITNQIEQIKPFDAHEQNDIQHTLDWIASGAELFRIKKPDTPNVHLVSYFVPYDPETGKFLLVHHKKANLWLPPGGHVDPGEHPKETARREMLEELSAPAEFLHDSPLFLTVSKTQNDPNPHTDISLWYMVRGDSSTEYQYDSREFHNVAFLSESELAPLAIEPHLSRFLAKLKVAFNY